MKKFSLFFVTALVFAGFCAAAYAAMPKTLPPFVFEPAPVSKADCNKLKDRYGIKYCSFDNDYWVGAVFQCGGVHNLPSLEDFDQLHANTINKIFQNIGNAYLPVQAIDEIPLYTSDNFDYTPLPADAGWFEKLIYAAKKNADRTYYYILDIKIPTLAGALSQKRYLESMGQRLDSSYDYKSYLKDIVSVQYQSVSRNGQPGEMVYGICRGDLLKLY